jgi:hypothetical protein
MNLTKAISIAFACLALYGCSLIPKKVEFFQDKVPTYPEKTAKQQELERQTADLLVQRAQRAELAAIEDDSSESVLKPIGDTLDLAQALSLSLGPPLNPWKDEVDRLVAILKQQEARQNLRLEELRRRLDESEGKKVEGTGLFQVPYLTYLLIVGGTIVVAIFLVRIGVGIAAMFHPAAALAKAGLDIPLHGFAQVVKGGGKFLEQLPKLNLGSRAEAMVKEAFLSAQKQAQDERVKNLVKSMPGATSL